MPHLYHEELALCVMLMSHLHPYECISVERFLKASGVTGGAASYVPRQC